jgi:hypothetical protein
VLWAIITILWALALWLNVHDAIAYRMKEAHHSLDQRTSEPERSDEENHRNAERLFWNHQRTHNRWVTIFSALAAVAAVAAAVVAILAYSEAWRQANAAWEQVRISRETEYKQLRAFIAPLTIKLQCPDCDNLNYKEPSHGTIAITANLIDLTVKAVGQTPAYHVRLHHLDWQVFPKTILYPNEMGFVSYRNVANVIEGNHTILPGDTREFLTGIRVKDFRRARNGEFNLRIYGNVDYDDIFGFGWTAEFCYVSAFANGTDSFVACPDHQSDYAR